MSCYEIVNVILLRRQTRNSFPVYRRCMIGRCLAVMPLTRWLENLSRLHYFALRQLTEQNFTLQPYSLTKNLWHVVADIWMSLKNAKLAFAYLD